MVVVIMSGLSVPPVVDEVGDGDGEVLGDALGEAFGLGDGEVFGDAFGDADGVGVGVAETLAAVVPLVSGSLPSLLVTVTRYPFTKLGLLVRST